MASKQRAAPVAVVTCSARGIGLAIAEWFIANDYRVALLDIDRKELAKTGRRLKDPARVLAMWTHMEFVSTPVGSAPSSTELRIALSGDGARSFDAPRVVAPSPPGRLIINSRLARASDGMTLACYDSAALQDVPNQLLGVRTEFQVACMRSADGVAWSAPAPAGPSVYLPLPDP